MRGAHGPRAGSGSAGDSEGFKKAVERYGVRHTSQMERVPARSSGKRASARWVIQRWRQALWTEVEQRHAVSRSSPPSRQIRHSGEPGDVWLIAVRFLE